MATDVVRLCYHGEVRAVAASGTLRRALREAGLDPESVLAVRDGKRLDPELPLSPGTETVLLDSILGG